MRHRHMGTCPLLVFLLTALIGCAVTPPPSSTPSTLTTAPPELIAPLAWRETPVTLDGLDSEDLCFLPGQPDIVVVNKPFIGAVAYNLATGEQQMISRHAMLPTWDESCAVNGGSIYNLELDTLDFHKRSTLWSSSDLGDSWEQVTLPDDMLIDAIAVEPHDSARLYAVGLGISDNNNVQVRLYHSTDSGRTWEPRADLASYDNCAHYLGSKDLRFVPGSDGGALVAICDMGYPGSSNKWDYLLSIDEGHTFHQVGVGGMGGIPSFGDTGVGIVRLYTGGKGSSVSRSRPTAVRRGQPWLGRRPIRSGRLTAANVRAFSLPRPPIRAACCSLTTEAGTRPMLA